MNCIIPARKGSKGLPGKNTRLMCGKPLIFWTIDAASNSNCFEKIIISTDDENIIDLCDQRKELSVHRRPAHLALDDTTMQATVFEAIARFPCENYALLQPTSPLRNSSHIIRAKRLFERSGNSNLVSMTEVEIRPSLYYTKNGENGLVQIFSGFSEKSQRQFNPTILRENGGLYMFTHNFFVSSSMFFDETASVFLMSEESSVDVDTVADFDKAEKILIKEVSDV